MITLTTFTVHGQLELVDLLGLHSEVQNFIFDSRRLQLAIGCFVDIFCLLRVLLTCYNISSHVHYLMYIVHFSAFYFFDCHLYIVYVVAFMQIAVQFIFFVY